MKIQSKAILMIAIILAYHSGVFLDKPESSEHKFWDVMTNLTCESGACEEKSDHRHEHKKKQHSRTFQHYSIIDKI